MTVVEGAPTVTSAGETRRRTLIIGVLGCGTVGGGVVARLLATGRAGNEAARLGRVLVRDLRKPREPEAVAEYLTSDPADVVDDPTVDIVVETIGGVELARELIERALRNGKHVVTANKTLVALHGRHLSKLARRHHVALRFEAAVGGAVPIVRAVGEAMAAERILEIAGVMNGTSNFIVGEMAQGSDFQTVLARAQELGFAEPDPTNDVDCHDAAQKLAVLGALGFRSTLDVERIRRGSLRALTQADFALAARLDCAIVPLALARRTENGVAAVVAPSFVPRDHDFARAKGPGNVIRVHGEDSGPLQLSGTGAGRVPTASAVFADLAEISHKMARWEYLGSDVLPEETVVTDAVVLPAIVRGDAAFRAALRAELDAAGVACRECGDDAVYVAATPYDDLVERVRRVGAGAATGAVFPCFETTHL